MGPTRPHDATWAYDPAIDPQRGKATVRRIAADEDLRDSQWLVLHGDSSYLIMPTMGSQSCHHAAATAPRWHGHDQAARATFLETNQPAGPSPAEDTA